MYFLYSNASSYLDEKSLLFSSLSRNLNVGIENHRYSVNAPILIHFKIGIEPVITTLRNE